jgi:ribosomal-protein-alanine N-acetyltransferase
VEPKPEPLATLYGSGVVLRRLEPRDALSLAKVLADEEVTRFVHQPPSSELDWGRFINWCHMQHEAGILCCWAVVADGCTEPVGVVQLRRLDPEWHAAEWGILLAAPYWGSGVCLASACCALQFAFSRLGVHRIEARVVDVNGRARRMLQKLGAIREATLRHAFQRGDTAHDQEMWSILAHEWDCLHAAPVRMRLRSDTRQSVTSPDA